MPIMACLSRMDCTIDTRSCRDCVLVSGPTRSSWVGAVTVVSFRFGVLELSKRPRGSEFSMKGKAWFLDFDCQGILIIFEIFEIEDESFAGRVPSSLAAPPPGVPPNLITGCFWP